MCVLLLEMISRLHRDEQEEPAAAVEAATGGAAGHTKGTFQEYLWRAVVAPRGEQTVAKGAEMHPCGASK